MHAQMRFETGLGVVAVSEDAFLVVDRHQLTAKAIVIRLVPQNRCAKQYPEPGLIRVLEVIAKS